MPTETFELHGVRIDAEGIAELDENQRAIQAVAHSEIAYAELGRGSGVNQPILQCFFGGLLLAIGGVIVPLNTFPDSVSFEALLAIGILCLGGALLLIAALRPHHILVIRHRGGPTRIRFPRRTTPAEVRAFREACKHWGCDLREQR